MIDEEVFVLDFLEHHGIKGQKWGVRKQKLAAFGKSAASNSWRATKATGRGTWRAAKATGRFSKRHPKVALSVVAGAAATVAIIKRNGRRKVSSPKLMPFSASGKNWTVQAQSGHTFETLIASLNRTNAIGRMIDDTYGI